AHPGGEGPKKTGVTSAVSDESVAGDSGVYEPSERKYVRLAVLPSVQATRCLFRTRGLLLQDVVVISEVFGMQMSHSALRQKTLRVDICNTSKSGNEECLAGAQISLADVSCSKERCTKWYNLLSRLYMSEISSKDKDTRVKGSSDQLVLWSYPSYCCVTTIQVNKETCIDNLTGSHQWSVVRPKERRPEVHQQNLFMRGNTIIRSKTFSPGPQSQYICRVTDGLQH
ncbi:hypothetical protein XENOCAPTIV_015001, partial [Xenoophorus captivus]